MRSPSVHLAAALVVACVAPAAAAVGEWGAGTKAEVRLVAEGVGEGGTLSGGIEIALPPGWKTYWRYPGDAGVAPQFDFSGSSNVGNAEVGFPVPTREDDGFAVTNVYADHVLLPFTATVSDRSAPVDIVADVKIGACSEICIPEDITVRLTVPPGTDDGAVGDALASARRQVPGPPLPGVFAFSGVTRDGGSERRPVFRFTGVVPDPANATLFIEGPAGWAPYTPELVGKDGDASVWSVKFSRLGADTPIAGAKFRLTVVDAGQAIDQTVALP